MLNNLTAAGARGPHVAAYARTVKLTRQQRDSICNRIGAMQEDMRKLAAWLESGRTSIRKTRSSSRRGKRSTVCTRRGSTRTTLERAARAHPRKTDVTDQSYVTAHSKMTRRRKSPMTARPSTPRVRGSGISSPTNLIGGSLPFCCVVLALKVAVAVAPL
jgi:hypothetical protein